MKVLLVSPRRRASASGKGRTAGATNKASRGKSEHNKPGAPGYNMVSRTAKVVVVKMEELYERPDICYVGAHEDRSVESINNYWKGQHRAVPGTMFA